MTAALLDAFAYATAAYSAAYHVLTLVMLVVAVYEIRRQRRTPPSMLAAVVRGGSDRPRVSVLVPAFNEASSIVATVRSVLALDYPNLEVVVVSDGSTDATTSLLWEAFDLLPSNEPLVETIPTQEVRSVFVSRSSRRLTVVDKRNGGKADALNAGLNVASGDLVLAVDADVILHEQSLLHLVAPFLNAPSTVATSGLIRPENGCVVEDGRLVSADLPRSWIERLQVIEYLRAYGLGRQFFNPTNSHLIISGAFGLFRRQLLIEIGGYQPHAVGEDMELVVRIHRYLRERHAPYRITFCSDALCLTDAPHSVRDLGRQRTRWHQGLLSTLRLHKGMALRSRYGAVGLLAFPFFFVELWAPVAEAAGWVGLPLLCATGVLPLDRIVPFLAASVLLGIAVSLVAILFDRLAFGFYPQPSAGIRLALMAIIEHAGYRQLTVWYRLRAFWRYYTSLQLKTAWKSPARMPLRPSPTTGAEHPREGVRS